MDKKLLKEFEQYCKLNEIEDTEGVLRQMCKRWFGLRQIWGSSIFT